MKQIRFIAAIAAAAALLAACTKEMDAPQGQSVSQITASWAESQTKTVLGEDGTSILWSPKDEISVFYNGEGLKFTSTNTTPKATTMFVSSGTVMIGSSEGYGNIPYLYGIYPYSSYNAQEGEYLTLTVPATQTAVDGSFARGAFPSVGRSKDTDIAFYNVCGGIRFSVTTSGVKRVVFSGKNNENLAGKVKIVFDQDGKPVVTTTLKGVKKLMLYNKAGFTPGKFYYISAMPTILANGYEMVFYTDSKHATQTSSSAVEIKRSVFGTLKDADAGLIYEDGSIDDKVDLGLSVKWATCNLGASKPEEDGTYFAWGEVIGQTWDGSYELDEKGNLRPEYDAACVNLGGAWRMPTEAEQQELISNCTSTWTSDYNGTGVAGRVFTSNKEGYTDKSIFLPAGDGACGMYWSSTLCSFAPWDAVDFFFKSDFVSWGAHNLGCGFSIRPVYVEPSDPTIVDLGLSVKWRSCNVGASKPEEYGTYFAWGDVAGQTWNGSSWSGGGFYTYPTYEVDENNNLKPAYDAAHVNLGSNWRMPTKAEQQELIDNCTSTWTSDYNGTGVAGRVFTSNKEGYTDKSIFLPASGYVCISSMNDAGSGGYYYSSTFSGGSDAWGLDLYSDYVGTGGGSRRHYGRPVRPVTE